MKKVISLLIIFLLTGCSSFNKSVNDFKSWENEKTYCVDNKKIWVLERGNVDRIVITSQIVGEC